MSTLDTTEPQPLLTLIPGGKPDKDDEDDDFCDWYWTGIEDGVCDCPPSRLQATMPEVTLSPGTQSEKARLTLRVVPDLEARS